jgi:hypothetical protein
LTTFKKQRQKPGRRNARIKVEEAHHTEVSKDNGGDVQYRVGMLLHGRVVITNRFFIPGRRRRGGVCQ